MATDEELGFFAREMMVAFCDWFKENEIMTKDDFFKVQKDRLEKIKKRVNDAKRGN